MTICAKTVLAFLLGSPSALFGSIDIQKYQIVLGMRIDSLEQSKKDGVKIVTKSDSANENWGVIIRFPVDETLKQPSQVPGYRFYGVLEPCDEESRLILDKKLTDALGRGNPQTMFKRRGYQVSALVPPITLAQKGGKFALVDPGIDGGLSWTIEIEIRKRDQSVILTIFESHY